MLIVNTASACGFTPQYKGLQARESRSSFLESDPTGECNADVPHPISRLGCPGNLPARRSPLVPVYDKYSSQGLEILGFPSNQFGGQEPGSADEIADFCVRNHGVSFPLMDKSDVNGEVSGCAAWGWDGLG